MAQPTITSAVYQGGVNIEGTELLHYSIPYTNKELFDNLTTELKNGASLIENAVMGGGVSLDGVDQYVDSGVIFSPTGSPVGISVWLNINSYNGETRFFYQLGYDDGLKYGILLGILSDGKVYVQFRSGDSESFDFKVSTSTESVPIQTWTNVIAVYPTNPAESADVYINAAEGHDIVDNNNIDTIQSYSYVSTIGARRLNASNIDRPLNGIVSSLYFYSGEWSPTDISNLYNQTEYYYKAGGTGPLIPIEPNSTTSTTATFNGVSVGDLIYVFNKDGFASALVTSGISCPMFFKNRLIPRITNFAVTSKTGNSEVKTGLLNSTLGQTRDITVLWEVHTDEISDFVSNLETNYNSTFEEDFQGRDPFETGTSANFVRIVSINYNFKRIGETMWQLPVTYRLVE